VHEAPVPPEVVDSRTPAPLAAIIMKCLSKNPDDRFQRGNDVADALLQYLAEQASLAEFRTAWLARAS
jgi:serine/threonine-protein kinase